MAVRLSDKETFDRKVEQAVVRYTLRGPVTLGDALRDDSKTVMELRSAVNELRSELWQLKRDLGYRARTTSEYRPWYRRIFS